MLQTYERIVPAEVLSPSAVVGRKNAGAGAGSSLTVSGDRLSWRHGRSRLSRRILGIAFHYSHRAAEVLSELRRLLSQRPNRRRFEAPTALSPSQRIEKPGVSLLHSKVGISFNEEEGPIRVVLVHSEGSCQSE